MYSALGSSAVERLALLRNVIDEDSEDLRQMEMGKECKQRQYLRLGLSFFLFGLINNVLYVIILSAALDLVPPSTPKGIIAFCNIAPSLVAKGGWPYILKGRIRYARRLVGCCMLSSCGMLVVALFDSIYMRLLGISLASFSSGLGELTFLQLSTTYAPPSAGGHAVGYFSSGTGAAGLVGALMWWELRNLGVRVGVGLSSVLPLIIPLTYFIILPKSSAFLRTELVVTVNDDPTNSTLSQVFLPYTPVATEDDVDEEESSIRVPLKEGISLSAGDKWRIVAPLLPKFMLPLFFVYLFEYTINQGIAPTLLYSIPTSSFLSRIIRSVRDYYPLWQLVYQTTVFFSRSSISLGIPALPSRILALPAVVQFFILVTLALESSIGIFPTGHDVWSVVLVFVLISAEGVCGGLAYVNVFHRINQQAEDLSVGHDLELARQEREFRIGSVGFADSLGILIASLVAMPTEITLCRAQVRRGKRLCEGL